MFHVPSWNNDIILICKFDEQRDLVRPQDFVCRCLGTTDDNSRSRKRRIQHAFFIACQLTHFFSLRLQPVQNLRKSFKMGWLINEIQYLFFKFFFLSKKHAIYTSIRNVTCSCRNSVQHLNNKTHPRIFSEWRWEDSPMSEIDIVRTDTDKCR